jgi:hypothetical protein
LATQLRFVDAVATENVSRRNLFKTESLVKDARLRPFAGARRPKKDNAHDYRLMNPR